MEFYFGTEDHRGVSVEVVKVKSDRPVELSGKFSVEREYTDAVYTDTFSIVKRIRAKFANGVFYTWYELANHIRYMDKFTPGIKATEQEITDHDLALMEAEQEITDLDLRLMELELEREED